MPEVKASDILTIKKIMRDANSGLEAVLIGKLSPETLHTYRGVQATAWISYAAEAEIIKNAAALIFPQEAKPIKRLGSAVANIQFQGIYRVFLAIATVDFLLQRIAGIWRTMHKNGKPRAEGINDGGGIFLVEEPPAGMLGVQREYIAGYLESLLEKTNVKNVRVVCNAGDPKILVWNVIWEKK